MEKVFSESKREFYKKIIQEYINPNFQDITPMFNDSVPFLVSGEMLMLTALTDNSYNNLLGGQSLHFIYICERLLNFFKKNNGCFEIVFFNVWQIVLDDSELCLYRQILIKHFEKNTDVTVHCFDHVYDSAFLDLIDTLRPGFFLYNLDWYSQAKFLNKWTIIHFIAVFCAEFTFCLKSDLPIVDLATISVDVSIVKSYLLQSNENYTILPDFSADIDYIQSKKTKEPMVTFLYQCEEIRKLLVCNAVRIFLKEHPKQINDVRLFVLYIVAMENLKLQNRGCPLVKLTNSEEIEQDVVIWQKIIVSLLRKVNDNCIVWKNVCDLWQGTLLAVVYSSVTESANKESLGEFATFYEHYIEKINTTLDENIVPYPIEKYSKSFCEMKMPYCRKKDEIPLKIVNNRVTERFCENLIGHISWADPTFVLEKCKFSEIHHWHSKREITDDYDHVKHNEFDRRNATKQEISGYDRSKQFQAKWLTIYGTNLVGDAKVYSSIICEENSKPVKQKKGSCKAKLMLSRIEMEKENKVKKNEEENFLKLKREYKAASELDCLKEVMEKIELFVEKTKTTEITLNGLVLKVRVHDKICAKLMKQKQVLSEIDIEKLFLTIRQILTLHHNAFSLNEKQQKQISKILWKLGFGNIALQNNLQSVQVDSLYNNEDSVRFQLRCLGPKLEREITGEYDSDVGFTPDPWQTKFIHAIRNNQSALVVAPTSSGKTFASYYCMKRVLQKSKDGIVIYVSPTKALVNQVSATISVKFRNTPLQPGISVVGVFTRDYRINAMNSRILVTVPQCLEILLMSPRRYTWAKNIKYVIFDEIHCLKGGSVMTDGITWERCVLLIRCPFLALSATIRNPQDFHQWLVETEKFKEQEDIKSGFERTYDSTVNLVVYSERHTDLIKYTYLKGKGLQHCHPYSFLSHDILNLHRNIPDGTSLSAYEVLQLYDIMKANAPDYFMGENEINTFFTSHSKNGFITHKDVKDFEKVLSKLFFEIYITNIGCYQKILNDLQPTHTSTAVDVGFQYSRNNMIDLINILHKKNMLPALIFSYNRNYIERYSLDLVEHFDSLKVDILDKREMKKLENIEKKEKKLLHKQEAKAGDLGTTFKKAHKTDAFNLLAQTPSFLKGIGHVDSNDLHYIQQRLSRTTPQDDLVKAMKHGFAFHHAGLNNKWRSTVEMLFRTGLLKVVFATGTLAMGIHMPCKTVVICCDSAFLNSLEYHQMSGRAGRRGFDNEGSVVFMGINKRRQKTLITSKLPVIDGNFPLTVTFIMRLLLLVSDVTDSGKPTEECLNRTLSKAVTLLENFLAYRKFPMLREQMKHFFCFATQLLLLQKLISNDGTPLKFCSIIVHLHYHEPANFAFVYILRSGAIRKMIKNYGSDHNKIEWNLIVLINFLFARLPLHKTMLNRKFTNSCVILDPIPEIFATALEQYNKKVKFVFDEYFASMNKYCTENYGPDNKLPLSQLRFENGLSDINKNSDGSIFNRIKSYCQTRSICSTFSSLSSHGDNNLYSETNLINNIRDEICPEAKVVPTIDIDLKINSYAADFYRHGIVQAIIKDNGLKHGQEYQLLYDFQLVLKTIILALEELGPIHADDVVLHHFRNIHSKYKEHFVKAFH